MVLINDCQHGAISIHAPAKGATVDIHFPYYTYVQYFNPRSREGSDQLSVKAGQVAYEFQSTLPRRERRGTATYDADGLARFQSTLPRRERPPIQFFTYLEYCNFNPRSREGSDALTAKLVGGAKDFNPRSREGSDEARLPMMRWSR